MFVAVYTSGCVMSGTHEAVLKQLDDTKKELAETGDKLTKEAEAKKNVTGERDKCQGELKVSVDHGKKLDTELVARNMQIETLLGEKGTLAEEREKLTDEQRQLAQQIEDLKKMKAAAEKRNADFKKVLEKLAKMVDAGTLEVKRRNGRILVVMSSDVVFPPGGTRIKLEAQEAIMELADTIASFPDRKFQVIGHSDSTPIRTARFPSNWELSSQRAIEVVKLLIEGGVPAEMLSAAGNAEFDPLVDNETPENRATNRRVEIIFVPQIDELPGMEMLDK
jgi:chemotaxis protein MotB